LAFVLSVEEDFGFDEAFVDEGLEDIVDFTHTQADLLGKGLLRGDVLGAS